MIRIETERDRHDLAQPKPGTEERQRGEAVAEEKGEPHGQGDLGHVSPPESGGDHHAGDLADHASRQAVVHGGRGEPIERRSLHVPHHARAWIAAISGPPSGRDSMSLPTV
jgi:hypothetical protein